MKLWMTQGGRTALRPSWLKMIAIWKHTHMVVHNSGNNFMLTHTWQATRGNISFSASCSISFYFILLTHSSANTTGSEAFIFNQHFLRSSLQLHLLPLLGSYCNCRYSKRVKHLTNTDDKVCIEYKPGSWEQQKEQLCALATQILPPSSIPLIWFRPVATD